ncbi:Sodium-coupled monocarboxylate transporter 1 [Cryptotermes secundus]|uniref:Sodium-coupled monocarboxylate transporter 1 n=2 Tax=Cryptotermes secundus TaxID=105785 RepID=A0A2J7QJQ3_9NEOP|nr:sodium-coupled monocarboxylate transporter 1 isoform X3 [Cryptotermes secundus]XP_033608445.1 sodium-coupled monocarboxylate transporter 1 isoform X3 [Cryptotermes secundus]XP_033608446.1 sodium-coupled monocarboxylate transporter 1 isoform X3 [Cryptotermes secundus]PNF28804.1 Sodium-coupled monocarboxylate transporter 1 [Cryptotermes secundus]PNF28805.1 Sodium-coupled monocarboxylate transporter 1 [Cryptotermes secundus]
MMDVPRASVEYLGMAMRRFGPADYVVFVSMLLVCAMIGVYYGFCTGKLSEADYLMGGRNMQTFPVAMSLIASFISGITLLGTPTEVYVYGIQYVYIVGGVLAMGITMGSAYLPVFHDLQLTSTYEYLEKRFNKHVRLFGSFLFSLALVTWLPIVIYVPALAFNQVTGVNVHIITPAVCIVCIFYTCVGGLKAVVWTDVVQTLIMFGAMVFVIIKGTIDVGGLRVVWERNYESGRIEAPIWDLNPATRHTVWVLVIGGFVHWLQGSAMNQYQLQRYLALPTLKGAKNALWLFVMGASSFIFLCSYSGMLVFATYYKCDPLTTKLAVAKDQLLPLLVMDTLKDLPGVPGLFVAGVFSAALSSMSTGLNSMAAVVLEDFYKTWFSHKLSPRQTDILMKTVVVVVGTVCVGLVFVVEKLGAVLQMSMSLSGITHGASLGIFSMGLFLPWVNSKGALAGGVACLGFMSWVCLGTQAAIAAGDINFQTKPVSVEGCTYDFVTPAPAVINSTMEPHKDEVFALYRMSYLWYTLLGTMVSMSVALIASVFTNPTDPASLDPRLLSPVIRRFLPKKNVKQQDVDMALLSGYKP